MTGAVRVCQHLYSIIFHQCVTWQWCKIEAVMSFIRHMAFLQGVKWWRDWIKCKIFLRQLVLKGRLWRQHQNSCLSTHHEVSALPATPKGLLNPDVSFLVLLSRSSMRPTLTIWHTKLIFSRFRSSLPKSWRGEEKQVVKACWFLFYP